MRSAVTQPAVFLAAHPLSTICWSNRDNAMTCGGNDDLSRPKSREAEPRTCDNVKVCRRIRDSFVVTHSSRSMNCLKVASNPCGKSLYGNLRRPQAGETQTT